MGPQGRQDKQPKRKFDMRWNEEDLQLIRAAAKLKRVDPSTFIRQQALAGAEAVVHEQQRFVLSAEQWQLISEAFERPAKALPNLSRIMSEPDEWETDD